MQIALVALDGAGSELAACQWQVFRTLINQRVEENFFTSEEKSNTAILKEILQ